MPPTRSYTTAQLVYAGLQAPIVAGLVTFLLNTVFGGVVYGLFTTVYAVVTAYILTALFGTAAVLLANRRGWRYTRRQGALGGLMIGGAAGTLAFGAFVFWHSPPVVWLLLPSGLVGGLAAGWAFVALLATEPPIGTLPRDV